MTDLNSSLSQNLSFVRPEYFYISGFSDEYFNKIYFISFIFIYIFSLCGNSIVLLMILAYRSLHVPKYMGIFNLALADFGETNALIPEILKTFLSDSRYISYEACFSNMFFVFFFAGEQALTLVALALDRLIAICLPLRYHAIVNNSSMRVTFTAIWTFNTFMFGTMVSLMTRLSFCKSIVVNSFFCDHGPVYKLACNDNSITYSWAKLCTVVYLYAAFVAILISYLGILLAMTKITTWEDRIKALKTCGSHLLVVGIFFLPILGTYLASEKFYININARIINTSLSMALPPMLNPIVYVLSTKEFRGLIMKMFKKTLRSKFSSNHSKQFRVSHIQPQIN